MKTVNPDEDEVIDLVNIHMNEVGGVLELLFQHMNLLLVLPRYGYRSGEDVPLQLRRDILTDTKGESGK